MEARGVHAHDVDEHLSRTTLLLLVATFALIVSAGFVLLCALATGAGLS